MRTVNYKLLPHPSDICIEVEGKNLKELFINSARAVVSELGKIKRKTGTKRLLLKINGIDIESLLINWLQEVLYNFYVRGLIFANGKIKKITEKELAIEVEFIKFTPRSFEAKKEIKAITYHNIKIERKANSYVVNLLLDI